MRLPWKTDLEMEPFTSLTHFTQRIRLELRIFDDTLTIL
jgi:hypothetical protein